ncbi:MAG TPA: AraC family transcriptional regulator [Steroidobacteraceae bacterium]|nr:AraC family transcriptional regulator [Steroidobacteraceae bacterium]
MDPLSQVLGILKPRSYVSAGLDAGGDWAIRFPAPDGIKFNTILRGACWLCVEGDTPRRIESGDCFLLTQGRPFILASRLALEPVEARVIYERAGNDVAVCNGGGDFFLIGGRYTFANNHAHILFGALPPAIHITKDRAQASVLHWSLEQLASEVRDRLPGGALVAEHLAHIMLVQVLRLYLNEQDGTRVGWFFALADQRIGPVLSAMHSDPSRRWTLQELAALARMSRSTFAERFKNIVGSAPLEYLVQWRAFVACSRLRNSKESLMSIAASLGYESPSAFSAAFKRIMQIPPGEYRRANQEAP